MSLVTKEFSCSFMTGFICLIINKVKSKISNKLVKLVKSKISNKVKSKKLYLERKREYVCFKIVAIVKFFN